MEKEKAKETNLLTAIEQIVEKAKDSHLSKDFVRKVTRHLNYGSSDKCVVSFQKKEYEER